MRTIFTSSILAVHRSSAAASAPVIPLEERTLEYLLKLLLTLQLAHRDRANPGAKNRKYMGSKIILDSLSCSYHFIILSCIF